MDLVGKKVLVVGMKKSGQAVVEALNNLGAEIFVQDSNSREKIDEETLKFLKEKHTRCFFGETPSGINFDLIVLSPSVPSNLKFILEAQGKGAEVIGELEFAYRLSLGKFVGITGTNGKTTTTALVGEIFKATNRKTEIVGNIGIPATSFALESKEDTWFITEVSSFQLETVKEFKPVISALLNLSPDHMDRHSDMDNYGEAKARIFMNQTEQDYLVVNFDDKECMKYAKKSKGKQFPFSRKEKLEFGVFVEKERIIIRDFNGKNIEVCKISDLKIPGKHNLENGLAAIGIAFVAGIDVGIIKKVIKEFRGVSHRIEICESIDGVKYVNDSKGTNIEASIKAIEAMEENIILIAGGYDKSAKFDQLVEAFEGRVKYAILLGETAAKIKESAERYGFTNTIILGGMKECVEEAHRVAKINDTVLLSPACASWDMYKSFEERGEDFKSCVRGLRK